MAHLLALTLARTLALAVGFGSFALYMAAFFFPEVHRKHDLIWSGVGLLYAVVLWFCAGQLEGALLLGQISGVALLGWLGWQVLTLRRIKTPIQQQTLPGASSQDLTQVALDQAKAAADNFSLAETATAIAGVTSSAIAAARGQSPPPSAQACPVDLSAAPVRSQSSAHPVSDQPATQSQPAPKPQVTQPSSPAESDLRSQQSSRQPASTETTNALEQTQPKVSESVARTSQPVNDFADEEILQPIVSSVESTPSVTSPAIPTAEAESAADDWGNWLDDEEDLTAETVTIASAQADTIAQASAPTVDRSAVSADRIAQTSAPVSQPAQPQSQNQSKLGALTAWLGGLLPFGKKKKSQPMVTLPPRESSFPRSSEATQSTPIQSSQPMLTIPRRESSLRRPGPSTPNASTTAASTTNQAEGESAIAPDAFQTPNLSDDANGVTANPDAVMDTSPTQTVQPSPEEILIPEALPSDEEAWGRFSAIANQEDETLTEAVLIEDAATTTEELVAGESVSQDSENAEDADLTNPEELEALAELGDAEELVTNPSSESEMDQLAVEEVTEAATDEATGAIAESPSDAATDEDETTGAIAEFQSDSLTLADTNLTVTPESPDSEASEEVDADDSELADSEAIAQVAPVDNDDPADGSMTESIEFVAEADGGSGDEPEHQSDNQPNNQPDDHVDADADSDRVSDAESTESETEVDHDANTEHPALNRPNPPSQELLNDLQRQHYTDTGRE